MRPTPMMILISKSFWMRISLHIRWELHKWILRTATGIGGKTALKALIARAGTSASYASVSQPTV